MPKSFGKNHNDGKMLSFHPTFRF